MMKMRKLNAIMVPLFMAGILTFTACTAPAAPTTPAPSPTPTPIPQVKAPELTPIPQVKAPELTPIPQVKAPEPTPIPQVKAPEEKAEVILREFTVEGTEWNLTPATIIVNKGDTVRITFRNMGSMPHNLTIAQLGVATATIPRGATETVEFVAEATGTFAFYCSVDGHRDFGMEGQLVVVEEGQLVVVEEEIDDDDDD